MANFVDELEDYIFGSFNSVDDFENLEQIENLIQKTIFECDMGADELDSAEEVNIGDFLINAPQEYLYEVFKHALIKSGEVSLD